MPTIKELKTLYKKGAGENNMTPLLKTTIKWVWSGETEGSGTALTFGFGAGRESFGRTYWTRYPRGFAVRSRK